jgi:deoxyribodipyrimidine photo-lyase
MRKVPDSWIFEPWKMPTNLLQTSNETNSQPIAIPRVDLALATRESKSKLHALRETQAVRTGKEAVVDKHTSRKTPRPPTKVKSAKFTSKQQLGFNF